MGLARTGGRRRHSRWCGRRCHCGRSHPGLRMVALSAIPGDRYKSVLAMWRPRRLHRRRPPMQRRPQLRCHRSDADFLRRTSGPSCLHSFALDLRKLGRNLLGKGIDPPADKAQKISAIEIAHKLWIGRAERFGRYEVRHPCPVWIKVGTTLHRTGILVRFKAGHTMVRHAIRPAIAPTSSPPCRIGDEIRSCTSSSGVRVYSSEIRYRRPQGRETKC
jgi:hypothetical protein